MKKFAGDHHFTHVYQKHYLWFLRYGARQTEFFVIMDRFLPFYPLWTQKIKIYKKRKKKLKYIIILEMFTVNDSYVIYGFSDIECNRQIFFVTLDCFLPFFAL